MKVLERKIKLIKISSRSSDKHDWELIGVRTYLKSAINFANKNCIEIGTQTEVCGYDEDYDIAYHSYHENGKLSINMCV